MDMVKKYGYCNLTRAFNAFVLLLYIYRAYYENEDIIEIL